MFYAIMNFVIAFAHFYGAFEIDKSQRAGNNEGSMVNHCLFLGTIFLFMGLALIFAVNGMNYLALVTVRLVYMLIGWFSISCCIYLLRFPDYKKTVLMTLFRLVFFVLALWVVFWVPSAVSDLSIDENGIITITSGLIAEDAPEGLGAVSWMFAYNLVYRVVIPVFVAVMVFARAEHSTVVLRRQNMLLSLSGFLVSWIVFFYLELASNYQRALTCFLPIGLIPQLYFFVKAERNDEIYDFKQFLRETVRFLVAFILPVVEAAVLYFGLYFAARALKLDFAYYQTALLICAAGVCVLRGYLNRHFSDSDFFRSRRYLRDFEKAITSIDFEREPKDIIEHVYMIFRKYVGSSSMKIMVDDGVGGLTCVYASDGNKPTQLSAFDQATVDALMDSRHQVIFREFAEKNPSVSTVKSKLLSILDTTDSEALIMLNEGRQFVGLILLGKKRGGNVYSEYDYSVFDRFYSNLFVIGYYVKNIMNEAVVGTVNREIRMSGQIITSIQENMDLIKSPKVEVGYLMVPAHNIGGEFVDMIRLTNTRHIFVIGALSGKGIAASMGMVILKSIIRTFLTETTDFKTLVAKVNVFIRESLPKGTYFAGTFGLIDFSTDTMYYINCGIPALFVYTRAYNNVIEVQGEGHILGFVKDVAPYLRVKRVKLSEGDIVMIVTDGILDTKSLRGDIYGKTRTQTALMENSSYPAERMVRFTYDAVVEFASKELENDITILVMKYLGNQGLQA